MSSSDFIQQVYNTEYGIYYSSYQVLIELCLTLNENVNNYTLQPPFVINDHN